MASNNKVFVSPGVYTSEVDLSFVAQSVGVTTLGIVGETLKGPAFEPIFIRNFDEFSAYFGGTSPEKFINTQIPKYEASYIAKAYLQQSNQLFVTRVLGLSGYDAGPSWSITTKANVDPTTIDFYCDVPTIVDCVEGCDSYETYVYYYNFSGCNDSLSSINVTDTDLQDFISDRLDLPYELFNGSISTLRSDINNLIFNSITNYGESYSGISYFGTIPTSSYTGLTSYTTVTNVFGVDNVSSYFSDYSEPQNDPWYYSLFDNIGSGSYTGSSFYGVIDTIVPTFTSSTCATFFEFSVGGYVSSFNNISLSGGTGYSVGSGTTSGSTYGTGLTVDVTVDVSNVVTGVTINSPGTGYQVGETITIIQGGSGNNSKIVISSLSTTTIGSINYNTNRIDVVVPVGIDLSKIVCGFNTCVPEGNVSISVTQYSGETSNNFSGGYLDYQLTSQDESVITNWKVYVETVVPCNVNTAGNTGTPNTGTTKSCYSGTVIGEIYVYSGMAYTDFDDLVIATLRSRGIATYGSDDGAVYEVSGLTDVSIDCTSIYSGITKNPYSTFGLNVMNKDGESYFFETSFQNSDSKYISKVFGSSNFAKPRTTVPLYVEERYQTLLTYGYRKGYIRGLNCQLTSLPNARQGVDPTSIAWYLEKYQSPTSPWVVSELRGNKVYNLFKFTTIADGDTANTEVKISIANISFNNGTFDVLVRDFYDSDSAPVVLEKFTNCNMNMNDNSFIAKKIGTMDGEYELNSKYVMIEINEDAPMDALPCGFLGFNSRDYAGVKSPFPIMKTKYDYPGEVIYNPPFGLGSGADDAIRSGGDNVRRTYLGISDSIGIDADFFGYKGKQLPLDVCNDITGDDWSTRTKGFHMDKDANSILIPNTFVTSGTPAFYVGDATFTKDPDTESSPYYRLFSRKFSFLVQGGFDGWDIYREHRTNGDTFVLGRNGYLHGSCPSIKYPTATGWGAFKQITVGDNTQDFGNTDYYAYKLAQMTFSNPEAVNINVFVTPGIDYLNNSDLVESAIDMIENDRADSLYVCTTPDYNMFAPSTGDQLDLIYPQEAVDNLDQIGVDSNYTATYYPWVLTRDSVNNTQIYLPATAEVTRNLALTDNIAFPWFAAAGYTRGIVNAVKARRKLTQEDRDTLYQGRINPIATFSDVGTVIWGNKTLQVRQSALDRINVRRLLLQARKLISAVSVRLLFEQNDAKVRQDFLDAVNPILDAIRRDRGLYDFRVTVSSDAADLDRNQMTGKIYIKPTKSLEFIDITFYITPTGASFENI
jgi:hypothetical protein